jgi:hypothetical protein
MSGEPIKVFGTEFRALEPFKGLSRAMEGVILMPVCDGKPVMSLCHRINKTENGGEELLREWAFIAGTTKVKHPNDIEFSAFSDVRFIDGNKQVTPEQCAEVTYESLRSALTRHVLNELTDLKKSPKSDEEVQKLSDEFDWFIQKVNASQDWEFIEITRPSTNKDTGVTIDDFQTSVGICRIILTRKEISDLNIQILKFQHREQRRFEPLEWQLQDGKLSVNTNVVIPSFRYGIPIDEYIDRVRNYFANIMFPKFGNIFAKLITK